MNIESIMSTDIVSVTMDDTLKKIQELFDSANFHHLLVIEDNSLIGVISDRDILKSISPYAGTVSELPRDAATMNKPAHQIMTRKPITISKDISISEATKQLLDNNISCLPVVSEDNTVEGIVTWKDLIKAYYEGENQ